MTTEHEHIFHIVDATQWDNLGPEGDYRPPSLDAEGFVHCSTAAQVADTAERYFSGAAELLLVEIRVDAVREDLRWEAAPEGHPHAGDLYPHIYAPVPLSAVAGARPLTV